MLSIQMLNANDGSMITIELKNPSWINGILDDPSDYCAHGKINFIVDGMVISREEEWTVSGAALFLLRSVFHNHNVNESVAESNYLIPCCASSFYKDAGERFGLLLVGCNQGVDPNIVHSDGKVTIVYENSKRTIALVDWAKAVVAFAEQIDDYYRSCSPKEEIDDKHDREGWEEYWREFNVLKIEANVVAGGT